jgi:hypothetical protein
MGMLIELTEPLLHEIRTRAKDRGTEPETILLELLNQAVKAQEAMIDEILGPFRQAVRDSKISDEELDKMFSDAREEVWQEGNFFTFKKFSHAHGA